MSKRYPFSLRKHGHDLMFRRNRAMNEYYAKDSEGTLTDEEEQAYTDIIDRLAEITSYYPDGSGVIWLEGKDWALAQESVAWAESARAEAHALANFELCRG